MAQALKLALESLPASRGGPVVYQTPNEQKLKRISEMKAQAKHLSATKGPAYYGQRK